jgi:hypothetical protein
MVCVALAPKKQHHTTFIVSAFRENMATCHGYELPPGALARLCNPVIRALMLHIDDMIKKDVFPFEVAAHDKARFDMVPDAVLYVMEHHLQVYQSEMARYECIQKDWDTKPVVEVCIVPTHRYLMADAAFERQKLRENASGMIRHRVIVTYSKGEDGKLKTETSCTVCGPYERYQRDGPEDPNDTSLPTVPNSPCTICGAVRREPSDSASAVASTQPSKKQLTACSFCESHGHKRSECPAELLSPVVLVKPVKPVETCRNCGSSDHQLRDCLLITCKKCGVSGHQLRNCPQVVCALCGRNGHQIHDCTDSELFRQAFGRAPGAPAENPSKASKEQEERVCF